MSGFKITDWDNAYANGVHIPNGNSWPEAWIKPASDFRAKNQSGGLSQTDISYGSHARQRYDLFYPTSHPQGLFVFVHGGYWLALDKSYWSHLAQGAVESGWAVAMPSYVLCPEANIAEITEMIANAVVHASLAVEGPIVLSGHSAGGHLVTSLLAANSPLPDDTLARIAHTVSLSGVHDLRPLLNTTMKEKLHLNETSAKELSPALMVPATPCRLTTWVGGGERAEFIRQSQLLSNIWRGLAAWTQCIVEPDKHHFNVIDALADKDSPLMQTALHIQ